MKVLVSPWGSSRDGIWRVLPRRQAGWPLNSVQVDPTSSTHLAKRGLKNYTEQKCFQQTFVTITTLRRANDDDGEITNMCTAGVRKPGKESH